MGNIKIEFELPEFKNELVVSVTLKKDGEVTTVSSSSPEGIRTTIDDSGSAWKQGTFETTEPKKKVTKKTTTTQSGNMMDMNF